MDDWRVYLCSACRRRVVVYGAILPACATPGCVKGTWVTQTHPLPAWDLSVEDRLFLHTQYIKPDISPPDDDPA